MKSLLKNLSLLSMGLMIYSCNEKISPELQSGNSTTIPTATAPDEYYFRVVNNSPTVLNYVLHRTGAGNATADCKISSSGTALSSTLYIGDAVTAHDSKTYDISCFMEAEEWAIYTNGLSFGVEASKNTCEYISYSPYSYFDAIPGSSTATYAGIKCADPVKTVNFLADADSVTAALAAGATLDGITPINCEQMVDTSIPLGSRVARTIPTDFQKICAFDYATSKTGNQQNCDTGKLTFNFLSIEDARAQETDPMDPQAEAIDEPDHSCGGKVAACVQGPIKQVPEIADQVRDGVVTGTSLNEDYSKVYTLPRLNGSSTTRSYMHDIVNYRRGLASMDLNFIDYTTPNEVQWGDTNYNKAFDPMLMEKYAANLNPDNTVIVDTTPSVQTATVSYATYQSYTQALGYSRKPFAADPFLGINGQRVNPFYTFYCLDRAMEIKARIRMVVRDWDKVFPSATSNMELLSDIYKNIGARQQDLPTDEDEIPNDPGQYNVFNDIPDWDNQIPMLRTDPNLTGIYDPADTFWFPEPTVSYPAGFWNPTYFPQEGSPGTDLGDGD